MISRREWYLRTQVAWPATVPAPTPEEAAAGARKLYRFVTGLTWTRQVHITSGNRYTGVRDDGRLFVNPTARRHGGPWQSIVHELSHSLASSIGIFTAHSKEHARLEARMIREVIRRGWLDGKLRRPDPPAPTAPPEWVQKAARLQRVEELTKQWRTKAKRAATALKKLDAEKKRLRHRLAILTGLH